MHSRPAKRRPFNGAPAKLFEGGGYLDVGEGDHEGHADCEDRDNDEPLAGKGTTGKQGRT